ncbi:MAG: hypothetical protein EXS14_09200 [Planctomycetes bacterium]|nr:hypothetical protein [Planctomycetota bacterium]
MTSSNDTTKALSGRGLHAFAAVLLVTTLFLLFAGGQVTSTDSGDAVDSWPLPLRVKMPEMVGGVFWELGHRHVAGFTGLLTGAFALTVLLRSRQAHAPAPWVRRLAYAAFGLVLAQAALGGLRVLVGTKFPGVASTPDEPMVIRAIAIVHALMAQAFLAVVTTLWVATRQGFGSGERIALPQLERRAKIALAAVMLQIALGAWLRHTMTDMGIVLHVIGALVALVALARVSGAVLSTELARIASLRWPAHAIGLVVTLQILLGVATLLLVEDGTARTAAFNFKAVVPSLHLVIAGVLVMYVQILWVRSWHTPAAQSSNVGVVREVLA